MKIYIFWPVFDCQNPIYVAETARTEEEKLLLNVKEEEIHLEFGLGTCMS